MKVGDKVCILRKDIFHLKHRKNRNGIITHINGAYVMVRPMWCNWEIELYPCEIKPCSNKAAPTKHPRLKKK